MSQWGKHQDFDVGNLRAVPLVQSAFFEPITNDSTILEVVFIRGDNESPDARTLMADIKKQFIGVPYSIWLESCTKHQVERV